MLAAAAKRTTTGQDTPPVKPPAVKPTVPAPEAKGRTEQANNRTAQAKERIAQASSEEGKKRRLAEKAAQRENELQMAKEARLEKTLETNIAYDESNGQSRNRGSVSMMGNMRLSKGTTEADREELLKVRTDWLQDRLKSEACRDARMNVDGQIHFDKMPKSCGNTLWHFGRRTAKEYFEKFEPSPSEKTCETTVALYELIDDKCNVYRHKARKVCPELWGHWQDNDICDRSSKRRDAAFWFAKGVAYQWQPTLPARQGMSTKQVVLFELLKFLDERYCALNRTTGGFLHLDLKRPGVWRSMVGRAPIGIEGLFDDDESVKLYEDQKFLLHRHDELIYSDRWHKGVINTCLPESVYFAVGSTGLCVERVRAPSA